MRKFFCVMLLLLTVCATTFAEEIKPSTIAVSGEGLLEVSPDRATICVGVVTREKNPSDVQNSNARAASNVINAIVALGIERKNISTGNYNFSPVYRHLSDGKRIIDGYEATNSVTVVVDELNLVGRIIDAALSHGANRVDSLNFGLRDNARCQDEAVRLAVLDAKRKAQVAAAALGQTIVGVRSVVINSSSLNVPRNHKMARAVTEDVASFDTPVESGTVTCAASVRVEFEIR